ncbi:MAG: glycosyltransferase family 25 protein [Hydrogenophilaceae bacterium]|nr:glycosyltransferase family 25 protein [Hydrogenophilaceae bacterium]
MELSDYFQRIYIINLPARADRRREMQAQLESIGLGGCSVVEFFPAIRPDSAGDFPSIGACGCFSSHLAVLRNAAHSGFERILILEDDVDFARDFPLRIGSIISQLREQPWGFFYGGYRMWAPAEDEGRGIVVIPSDDAVLTSHFVGFQAPVVGRLATYLEQMLARPAGDPLGGPMHVDGAYSWFRRECPDVLTLAAVPELGQQRSSRTDIHDLHWYDRMPLIRDVVAALRRIKNKA